MRRNLRNRVLAGVLAGLADHTGIPALLLRVAAIFLSLGSVGIGCLVYLVAAIILPSDE